MQSNGTFWVGRSLPAVGLMQNMYVISRTFTTPPRKSWFRLMMRSRSKPKESSSETMVCEDVGGCCGPSRHSNRLYQGGWWVLRFWLTPVSEEGSRAHSTSLSAGRNSSLIDPPRDVCKCSPFKRHHSHFPAVFQQNSTATPVDRRCSELGRCGRAGSGTSVPRFHQLLRGMSGLTVSGLYLSETKH